MSGDVVEHPRGDYSECSVWVEFQIELVDQEERLPLADLDLPARVVRHHVEDDRCLIQVDVADEPESSEIAQVSVECDRQCVCHVVTDCGHVPHLKEYREDGVLIGTGLSNRAEIRTLVDRLDEISERVSLERLSKERSDSETKCVTIDLHNLTDKQQEAAMLAVSKGYYQTPRQTTIDQLAEELNITKSALSQRLSAVESKLAKSIFQDGAEA